jgi:Bacterial PH domain/Short C-terminal domain
MNDMQVTLVQGERVDFTTKKHWVAPVSDSGWAILMVLGALVLGWVQPDRSTGLLGFLARAMELIQLGLFLGGAGWIVYNVVAWRTAEYAVTNRRVLAQEGLVRRRSTDMLLNSVADVRTRSSFLGRALGYGTVRLTSSSGAAGEDVFTSVRGADQFRQRIIEQMAGPTQQRADTSPLSAITMVPPSSVLDYTEVIGQLARLRDAGALTQDEYDAKKAELLARL